MISALALCLLFAVEPFLKGADKELKTLEGSWEVVQIDSGGKKIEPGADDRIVLTIEGKKITFGDIQDGEITALDPSTNPKLIDFKSRPKNPGRAPTMNEAIYKIDGDKLQIATYQGADKKRPTNFDAPKDTGTVLWTLKRVEK